MKDISSNDITNNIPLVSRKDYKRDIRIGKLILNRQDVTVMAGPCTVESRPQIMEIAKNVKSSGAKILRGGVFKPLTFPYGDPIGKPDSDSNTGDWDRKKILSKTELFKKAETRLGVGGKVGGPPGAGAPHQVIGDAG